MKVIIDDKIPYIKGVIESIKGSNVVYVPGRDITHDMVKDADTLLIRTRTRCDRALLEGSHVQFIGTATIGFDHIDTAYCQEAGIEWANCPGCNAGAVEQYLHAVFLLLKKEKGINLPKVCLGIVGVGHVGSRIARMAKGLGMRILLNDPPRADKGETGFTDLETLARECDIITIHTPLVREGTHPTYHLINDSFFHSLKRKPYFINTARGEVTDTQALLRALDEKRIAGAIIDVWENEPSINLSLLNKVYIGTPHIAGYSVEGKANATSMVLDAFSRHFNVQLNYQPTLPPPSKRFRYNPHRDCKSLREHPELFEYLRSHYTLRRE